MKKLKMILLSFVVIYVSIGSNFINYVHAAEMKGLFQTLNIGNVPVYSYTASVVNEPAPMMTPVFFVYSDDICEDENEAYLKLESAGLIDLAEKEKAGVLLMTPANGKNWSEEDANVYWDTLTVLTDSNNSLGYFTYCNLIYALGEGNGATFIHNTLSQNANRIAGILTFGGNINSNTTSEMPLPAYLVGANSNIINFYKTINGTNEQTVLNGKQCFYNSVLDTKKVVIDDRNVNSLNKDIIFEAWHNMLRKITRNAMHDVIWIDAQSKEVFTLMDRVDYEESGLDFKYEQPDGYVGYYMWQPTEALNQTEEKFPLVFCIHGGNDHPVFEAECQGWVELASKERVIVVSPNGSDYEDVENYKAIIDYVCANYPVDLSRIYSTGISNGGCYTNYLATEYPELFAAVAPIAATPGYQNVDLTVFENKLPFFIAHGTNDVLITYPLWGSDPISENNHDGKYIYSNIIEGYINPISKINHIDFSVNMNDLDYMTYPFLGFDISNYITETFTTKHGIVGHIATFEDDESIPNFKYMIVEGLNHNHYTGYASIIWDFFNNFKRNVETGESIYLPDLTVDVDKKALEIAVEVANNVSDEQLEKVVPVVANEFNAALVEAQEVLANNSASQAQVDNAFARLANAMQMLDFIKGDKTALQAFVNSVSDLDANLYTDITWNEFASTLENANNVLVDENAMQDEVNEVYDAVVRAYLDLRLKPSKDLLNSLINRAQSLNAANYSMAAWQVVEDALLNAQATIANENATEEEVAAAVEAMESALAGLLVTNPENSVEADVANTAVKAGDTTASIKTGDSAGLGYSLAGLAVASMVLVANKKRK